MASLSEQLERMLLKVDARIEFAERVARKDERARMASRKPQGRPRGQTVVVAKRPRNDAVSDVDTKVESNGHRDALGVIGALRSKPRSVLVFRGFGPAVVAVVLFVLMLWLAPSVAPEHIVDKPVNTTTTTAVAN